MVEDTYLEKIMKHQEGDEYYVIKGQWGSVYKASVLLKSSVHRVVTPLPQALSPYGGSIGMMMLMVMHPHPEMPLGTIFQVFETALVKVNGPEIDPDMKAWLELLYGE